MIATNAFTLRPYQREAVDRAVQFLGTRSDRHGILVLPTGSGKSLVIANIVDQLKAPCLVFQPSREILQQNFAKLVSYGFRPAVYSASLGKKQISGAVTLATIGSVVKKPELFEHVRYVIVDECFVAGTLVDGKPIEAIQPGDTVSTLDHKEGVIRAGIVKAISRRPAPDAMCHVWINGRLTISTPSHPYYCVDSGYVPAQNLKTGDWVYAFKDQPDRSSALYSLRRGCENQELSPLLENTKAWTGFAQRMFNQGCGPRVVSENEEKESNDQLRCSSQNGAISSEDRTQASGSRWKRTRPYRAAARAIKSVGRRLGFGTGSTDATSKRGRLSVSLQVGLSAPVSNDSSGIGRQQSRSQFQALPGCQEDGRPQIARVDRIEIHQRSSDERYPDGHRHDCVYNLEIDGPNNNYFANGVLVHNCHLVNPESGMYADFFENLNSRGLRIIGLTATPYRLASTMQGSILRFLTRMRPRVFDDVVYYVQNGQLFRDGHLAKLEYFKIKGFDRSRLKTNSTGADYTDASVQAHFRELDFHGKLQRVVERLLEIDRKGVLVFTRFLEESKHLASNVPGAVTVSANTPDAERSWILKEFRAGRIRVVCNVGVLTTGFDYPELDTVVLARPTMSLALYYQMVGRCVRPHPQKPHAMVVDMVGLMEQFGRVEDLRIEAGTNRKWYVSSGGKQLTNVLFGLPRQ